MRKINSHPGKVILLIFVLTVILLNLGVQIFRNWKNLDTLYTVVKLSENPYQETLKALFDNEYLIEKKFFFKTQEDPIEKIYLINNYLDQKYFSGIVYSEARTPDLWKLIYGLSLNQIENASNYWKNDESIANFLRHLALIEDNQHYKKEILELSIKIFPNGYTFRQLGDLYFDQENYGKAINNYKISLTYDITEDKFYVRTFVNLGRAYYYEQSYNESITAFLSAEQYGNLFLGEQMSFSWAYFQAGEYNKSISRLKNIINKQPDYFPAWKLIAHSYYQLGDYEKAKESYLQYLIFQPNDDNVIERLDQLTNK